MGADHELHRGVVIALDGVADGRPEGNGVHWALRGDVDLNVNLVRLEAGETMDRHVNSEVDVAIIVLHGDGQVEVDTVTHDLGPHHLAVIVKGQARSIHAGRQGLTYLTVHRRRGPLTIRGGAG